MRSIYCILSLSLLIQLSTSNIESDLWDFIELIPRNRIALLSGRHFIFDANFRKALSYLQSTNFEFLVREEISESQEVQDVIQYLGREIDLNMIPIKIRRFIIRLRPSQTQDYGSIRSSTSFVQEIADLLPDGEIADLITRKGSTDPEFAELFSKIADSQFRQLIYRAWSSESMAVAVEVLRSNHIDLDQILEIAFRKIDKWNRD